MNLVEKALYKWVIIIIIIVVIIIIIIIIIISDRFWRSSVHDSCERGLRRSLQVLLIIFHDFVTTKIYIHLSTFVIPGSILERTPGPAVQSVEIAM